MEAGDQRAKSCRNNECHKKADDALDTHLTRSDSGRPHLRIYHDCSFMSPRFLKGPEGSSKKSRTQLLHTIFTFSLPRARGVRTNSSVGPDLHEAVVCLGAVCHGPSVHGTRGPVAPWPRVALRVRNINRLLTALATRLSSAIPRSCSDPIECKPRMTMDAEETLQQRRRRLAQVARAVGNKHWIKRRAASSG